jgi:hypothetical protein
VGITNYLDIGFRMASDLAGGRGSSMQLGGAWQANKNVLVKARVGLEGAALTAVLKSWWQPSFTLAGAAAYDWAGGGLRIGVTAAVETFKNIRWGGGGRQGRPVVPHRALCSVRRATICQPDVPCRVACWGRGHTQPRFGPAFCCIRPLNSAELRPPT